MNLEKPQLKYLLVLVLVAITLPMAAWLASRPQLIQKQAACAVNLKLAPASGSHAKNAAFAINLQIEAGTAAVEGATVELAFDASKMKLNSVTWPSAVNSEVLNTINNTNGTAKISAVKTSGAGVTGTFSFATLNFEGIAVSAAATAVTIGNVQVIATGEGAACSVGSKTNGAYTITAVAPTNTPGPTNTPMPTPTGTIVPTPTGTIVPTPTPTGTIAPTPTGTLNPINWQTSTVSLRADDFYILANGQKYLAKVANVDVRSDPGSATYTTLEATWQEGGKEMRLYIYFRADANYWWATEARTYDGRSPGDWIYYYGNFFTARLGSEFNGDILLNSDVNHPNDVGKLYFKNLRLQAFLNLPTPTGPVTALNLKFKINGITSPRPATTTNQLQTFKVTLVGPTGITKIYTGTAIGIGASGVVEDAPNISDFLSAHSTLTSITTKLFIKWTKSLQKKYDVTLTQGANDLNLVTKGPRYYLEPGDLPISGTNHDQQDGVVNSLDAVYLSGCLATPDDATCLAKADLNLDGIINTMDMELLNGTVYSKWEDEVQ